VAANIAIRRTRDALTGTGGSFDADLRDLLWRRAKAMLAIVLGVTLILQFIFTIILSAPTVTTPITRWAGLLMWVHVASLAVAAFALWLWRRNPKAAHLQQNIAYVMGFNLLLAEFGQATCNPFEPQYFAVGLILFITACYIPWPTRYQVGLGLTAVIGYLGFSIFAYLAFPSLREFAAGLGGDAIWRAMIASGTLQVAILAAVSTLASHTLYGLRRRVHAATQLGNYLIERELGRGGMGAVYLARHSLICRPTAVKVLESDDEIVVHTVSRFEREVRISATLTHPNTIQIYDYGRTPDGVFYYAMEFLEGLDLQRFVERFGPLEPARAVFITRQICGSLSEAHARGVVHRDIKPSNIFLTERGGLYDFVKVLDFGLAKELRDLGESGLTRTGAVFGTPRYMAPEAVYGKPLDARSDIYNVGCVAYCLLAGQPLFAGSSSMELIIDHARTVPLRPSAVTELPISADLEDLVMTCLEKNPDDRFQRVADLDAALARLACAGDWDHQRARVWWQEHGLAGETITAACAGDFPATAAGRPAQS